MASAIVTTATTLEGQFLEVMEALATAQANTAQNPDGIQVLPVYTRNMLTGALTFSGTIATDDTKGATGGVNMVAMEVYIDAV